MGRERKVVTECAFELSTHVIENRNLNLTLGSQSFYRSYDKKDREGQYSFYSHSIR